MSSIACSSSTMCARSLESWEHSYVHQRWCFYQSLLAWEFEFGQISLTKLDLAHWVFLAIIKELHEHRFGSHFVNDFPCFRNQIDPISPRHFVFRSSEEESSSPDDRVGVFVCGLQPARITWWASPNWPSSQTKVTSVNLLSSLTSPMEDCKEEEEFV